MKSVVFLVTLVAFISVTDQRKHQRCVVKSAWIPCNASGGCDASGQQCVSNKTARGCYTTCAGFVGRSCPNGLTCCFSYPGGVYKPTSPPGTADMSGICF